MPRQKMFVALVKGDQRYLFVYFSGQEAELLRQFGRWASNPDLDFNWMDAATLSARVRDQM